MTNLLDDQQEPTNYLDTLVGEGKKFKDQEALAKGKWEADKMIAFKNQEFDKLREDYLQLKQELDARAKLEDLLDQKFNSQNSQNNLNVNDEPKYAVKEIESLLSSKLQEYESKVQEREASKIQESNASFIKSKLTERYGANYSSAVRQQIEDLGISEDRFNELARKEPKLLIRTLGLDQDPRRERFDAPPQSEGRFTPRNEKRTWSYYQKMRKENPSQYLDPQTQLQLMRDRANLGQEFEDGDWHSIG